MSAQGCVTHSFVFLDTKSYLDQLGLQLHVEKTVFEYVIGK